jgi:hypothetical protein
MNFFQFLAPIPHSDFVTLINRIASRLPTKAIGDPLFQYNLAPDILCGIPLEPLTCKKHVVNPGLSTKQKYLVSKSNRQDRRLFDRYPLVGVKIIGVTATQQFEDVIPHDISLGGISVSLLREVEINPGARFGFSIQFNDQEILIFGMIANVRPKGTRQLVGVRFDEEQRNINLKALQDCIVYSVEEAERERKSRTQAA